MRAAALRDAFIEIPLIASDKKSQTNGLCQLSSQVRISRTVLDSGSHALDSEFQVLDFSLHHWNLDTGFQSLVGFWNPWAVFRIPDFTSKIFPDSGMRIPLRWCYTRRFATTIFSNTALKHCCDIVSNGYNIVPTLQRFVALNIVVANRPV